MTSAHVVCGSAATPEDRSPPAPRRISTYLQGRRGILVVAAAIGGAGLTFGWAWFGFAAVLPFLYVLPCAAMMAMCMRGHGGSGGNATTPSDPTSVSIDNRIVDETGSSR
jgi:hypothetical protein